MTPYIVGFGLVCAIMAIGLNYRRPWMWHLGWVIFYLFAAYFGNLFFAALYNSPDYRSLAFSLIYLAGGLVLWLPSILWWSRKKTSFDGAKRAAKTGTPGT